MKNLLSLLVFAMVLGCGGSDSSDTGGNGGNGGMGGTAGQDFSPNPPLEIGTEDRPAEVDIPTDYDPTVSYPLVMVLHGAGTDGRTETGYLQLFNFVDSKQFILTFPNATAGESGRPSWNSAASGSDNGRADDTAYLSGLIEEAKQIYNIDPKRVYLIGHSSGAFMSFRMACEVSTLFTAMVDLAGSISDPDNCSPGAPPVSVLVVHGTADDTIPYEGVPDAFPGAVEIVERSAAAAGCDPETSTFLESLDLIPAVDGDETDLYAYSTGCDEGLDAELWTMNDGSHIPFFQPLSSDKPHFPDLITDWLFRHSR